jgi:hypothetical protein
MHRGIGRLAQTPWLQFGANAIMFLLAGDCGRTASLDGGRNAPADADQRDLGAETRNLPADGPNARDIGSDATTDGGPARGDVAQATEVGALKLLAGALGGAGNQNATGASARFYFPAGIASDGAGNLFVTDATNSSVRKVVIATGAVSSLADWFSSSSSLSTLSSPSGIASDGAGSLFVADSVRGTIIKVVIATQAVTILAGSAGDWGSKDGAGASARFYNPLGVASDGAGKLLVADSSNHTIRQVVIASGAVSTLAGSVRNQGSADGIGTLAQFNSPSGVACDGAGNLFVADQHNHTIRKIVIATGAVSTFAGSAGNAGSADGTGADARFYQPSDLASDGAGHLFVSDQYNYTIRKIVIATATVSTLAGSSGKAGSADGTGTGARFSYPRGVASDGAGNVFLVDSNNQAIRQVDIATAAVTTLAGSPETMGSSDGTGADARFWQPNGLASDGAGNLFVADANNYIIRKIDLATSAVTTLAGSPGVRGHDDGTGLSARFTFPNAVASDGAGNLFVVDTNNHTIRSIVVATAAVTTLAGSPGASGSADGTGPAARFSYPGSVVADRTGNLFVADTFNNTIRKIVIATAAVTTLAGSATKSGSNDGIGAAARFYVPQGMAIDDSGNLMVADSANNAIRKIVVATGAVTTLAGSATQGGGPVDGTGVAARFFDPCGLASDGAGNLFVASAGSTLRKVVLATGAVTTVVGSFGHAGVMLGPLPAALNTPRGLVVGPGGELYITDEAAVLVARF